MLNFKTTLLFLTLFLALTTNGCLRDYTIVTESQNSEINRKYAQKPFYLTSSQYFGEFWGDKRYEYLTPYVPESLTYLSSITGKNIPPPPHKGIIPAGTPLRIERIEFPTAEVFNSRALVTPRYYPWVYCVVSMPERAVKGLIVIPAGIEEPLESIERKLLTIISEEDPRPKISALSEEEQEAIKTKIPYLGMSIEAAGFALGPAPEIEADYEGEKAEEIWKFYDGKTYSFDKGKLIKIE